MQLPESKSSSANLLIQEARRVALNVRNWQKHQNVQLPLGLFVTESLLCCHHRLAGTLCHHMKSWNCPLGDPPAITCWINFPLSRTFVRNARARQRGTEDKGQVGRKRIAAGASPQPSIVTCILIFILIIGILTSKARRRKMTMMDLTLVWTTLTTTTWTSTKWRCIRPPCMTPRKDPLRGVFQIFFYR